MAPPDYAADLWSVFLPALRIVVPAVAFALAAWFAYWGARATIARTSLTNSLRGDIAAKDAVVRVDREYVVPRKDPTTPEPFDAAAKVTARQMAVDAMRVEVPEISAAVAADKVERAVAELQAAGVISPPSSDESPKPASMRPVGLPPVADPVLGPGSAA